MKEMLLKNVDTGQGTYHLITEMEIDESMTYRQCVTYLRHHSDRIDCEDRRMQVQDPSPEAEDVTDMTPENLDATSYIFNTRVLEEIPHKIIDTRNKERGQGRQNEAKPISKGLPRHLPSMKAQETSTNMISSQADKSLMAESSHELRTRTRWKSNLPS